MEADMASGQWLMTGWLAVAGLTPGLAVAGDLAEKPVVVVHLVDLAMVADRVLTVAKTEVVRVFHDAGVDIQWAGAPIPMPSSVEEQHGAPPHVVLLVANAHQPPTKGSEAAGEAWRRIGRAYVFHNRISAEANQHATSTALVLGHAMAHEIGHLLLPPNSHSRFGIMRPALEYASVGLNFFDPDQARTMRTALMNAVSR